MRLPSPLPCIALLTLLASPPLPAHDGNPEGATKYRHHTMKAIGGHMQAIVDILRRDVPHTEHLPIHTGALAALAEITPTLFPPGSDGPDTEALPAIWENPEDFAKRVDAFREAAANLKEQRGGPPGRDVDVNLTGDDAGALKAAATSASPARIHAYPARWTAGVRLPHSPVTGLRSVEPPTAMDSTLNVRVHRL